jgi:hypothetical protein
MIMNAMIIIIIRSSIFFRIIANHLPHRNNHTMYDASRILTLFEENIRPLYIVKRDSYDLVEDRNKKE